VKENKDYIKKSIALFILLFFPFMIISIGIGKELNVEFFGCLFIEAFISIHMSLFVLLPLARIRTDVDYRRVFWKYFNIRMFILLICDFFVTPYVCALDFFAIFIGGFIIVPISGFIHNKGWFGTSNNTITSSTPSKSIITCSKCGAEVITGNKFCTNCGAPIDGNTVTIIPSSGVKKTVPYSSFAAMYKKDEDIMVQEFIKNELKKVGILNINDLMPREALKRKNILTIIFSVLLYVYVSLFFFHFPILTYIIGAVIIFLFYKYMNKFNYMKYMIKEVKSRPSEKISNIVMSVKGSLVEDNGKVFRKVFYIVAVILALITFIKPRILYEKMDGGYGVRYYAFGLTNFTSATIPEEHNGKPVISLRGNTFSNMFFLKEVKLPDTITEIRGQAFKNCIKLKEVNIPKNLEYLGGGAFYGAINIREIELPDTLTFLGGEAFKDARNLTKVKLSNQLTEIRGNTFENCIKLESIDIPDSVTRIGGHAFYNDRMLKKVKFGYDSQLKEIGSSAFRLCDNLRSITLPNGVIINDRAFKESPTIINYFDIAGSSNKIYNHSKSLMLMPNESDWVYDDDYNKLYNLYLLSSEYNSYSKTGKYEIRIVGNGIDETVVLYSTNKYVIVNDYMEIEYNSETYTEGGVYITLYYNDEQLSV